MNDQLPPSQSEPPSIAPASSDEKNLAIIMHLLCLIGLPIIGPLVVWLIKKDQSPYIDAQGRELLNFQISYLVYGFVAFLSFFVLIGFVLMPALVIAALILTIVAVVNAAEGKVYRFPYIFRLL